MKIKREIKEKHVLILEEFAAIWNSVTSLKEVRKITGASLAMAKARRKACLNLGIELKFLGEEDEPVKPVSVKPVFVKPKKTKKVKGRLVPIVDDIEEIDRGSLEIDGAKHLLEDEEQRRVEQEILDMQERACLETKERTEKEEKELLKQVLEDPLFLFGKDNPELDREIAQKYKLWPRKIAELRRDMAFSREKTDISINDQKQIPWDITEELGKAPDKDLAEKYGILEIEVWRERKKREISVYKKI